LQLNDEYYPINVIINIVIIIWFRDIFASSIRLKCIFMVTGAFCDVAYNSSATYTTYAPTLGLCKVGASVSIQTQILWNIFGRGRDAL